MKCRLCICLGLCMYLRPPRHAQRHALLHKGLAGAKKCFLLAFSLSQAEILVVQHHPLSRSL